MKDLEFIKQFSKITITKVCKELKIDRSNLMRGRCSLEKIKQVKEYIEKEYLNLEEKSKCQK